MELLKAIYERRNTREFTDADVRRSVALDLIQAAIQAPSETNAEPVTFAVFHGRKRLKAYSDRAKAHLLRTEDSTYGMDSRLDEFDNEKTNLFHDADTLIVICASFGRNSAEENCFLAAQYLILAAHGMGLGSSSVGLVRGWLNLPEVKAELGIPDHSTAAVAIVVGYPAHPPASEPRKDPAISCWHWDE